MAHSKDFPWAPKRSDHLHGLHEACETFKLCLDVFAVSMHEKKHDGAAI